MTDTPKNDEPYQFPQVYDLPEAPADWDDHALVPDVEQHPIGGNAFRGMGFTVLGYNGTDFFYFPFHKKQIVKLSSSQHTLVNLLNLDTREAWEREFRTEFVDSEGNTKRIGEKEMLARAVNELIKAAHRVGVFRQEAMRGCGIWLDNSGMIVNCGDILYRNGIPCRFENAADGGHVYVASSRLFRRGVEPLDNYSAAKLRTVCEALTFEDKLSGALLAGWIVVAPICGALPYRPHIWITGGTGSGKSTVRDKIIRAALGNIALNVDAGTTEPSIRQQMGSDARPLMYDEAEPTPNMENVIELTRKASTRGMVTKFGQNPFVAQYCACFFSVVPAINKSTDENRISLLVLKKNESPDALREYDDLLALIEETITPDFPERMLARTIDHLPTIIKNIYTFQRAARMVMRDGRASEQIGTLLGGLYFLGRTGEVTLDEAIDWIKQHDWDDYTIINQENEAMRLLNMIFGIVVRVTTSSGMSKNVSIGDMIMAVRDGDYPEYETALRYHGIKIDGDYIVIANRNEHMSRSLRGTDWEKRWSRTLRDVHGSVKRKSVYFGAGIKTDAMAIPFSSIKEG